jgi:DNA-binding NarL/FixJ family response regulator
MRWSILLYGAALGLLLAALQFFQYRLLILDHARELYTVLIAALFAAVGIWAGRRWRQGAPAPEQKPAAGAALPSAAALPVLPADMAEKLGLTPREHEVLQLIAQGYSNQEIAERLYVSLNTVKTHVSNLLAKLESERRTQAVRKARALGLVE